MKETKVDAFLVKKPENVFYLSGVELSEGSVLVTKKDAILIVDSRYYVKAKRGANTEVLLLKEEFSLTLNELLNSKKINTLAFEANYINFAQYSLLKKKLSAKVVGVDDLVEKTRQVKESKELLVLLKAAKLADKTMSFARHSLSHGITEIELAGKIECFIRQNGARSEAFETIVASGPNAAMPHHTSGKRHIKASDTVMIDLGVKVGNYSSDITRTFLVQPVQPAIADLYKTCLSAQEKAIKSTKSMMAAKDVDKVARDLINQNYEGKFGHSLGHGVGLEVHELPRINPKSAAVLQENMVFTIEPGIYLDGQAGVRIEDMVLVKKDGAKLLTKSPKQLKDVIIEL